MAAVRGGANGVALPARRKRMRGIDEGEYRGYHTAIVRPQEVGCGPDPASRRVELGGASPAAVSAGAPRSRPQAEGENSRSERGVESPQEAVGPLGRGAKVR